MSSRRLRLCALLLAAAFCMMPARAARIPQSAWPTAEEETADWADAVSVAEEGSPPRSYLVDAQGTRISPIFDGYLTIRSLRSGRVICSLLPHDTESPQFYEGVIELSTGKVLIPFEQWSRLFFLDDLHMLGTRVGADVSCEIALTPDGVQDFSTILDFKVADVQDSMVWFSENKEVVAAFADDGSPLKRTVEVYGLKNANCETILPAQFERFDGMIQLASPVHGNCQDLCFLDGLSVVKAAGDHWTVVSGGKALTSDGKWGVIDASGSYVVPPEYDYAQNFGYGRCVVWSANDSAIVFDGHGFKLFSTPERYADYAYAQDYLLEWSSDWAAPEIREAIAAGLLPRENRGLFPLPITRQEFCVLLMALYRSAAPEANGAPETAPFQDTQNPDVAAAYALGLVQGIAPKQFAPYESITREQAATMLCRLAERLGLHWDASAVSFADASQISVWAKDSVFQLYHGDIMQGVEGHRFSPQAAYTKEQSIATLHRMYTKLQEKAEPMGSAFS